MLLVFGLQALAQANRPELPAVREEIQKLYATLDNAYASGDFDAIKSIATSGAKFGSTIMQMPLDEAIARLKSDLGGLKLTSKTEITSIELVGDEAKVRTSSAMTLARDGATTVQAGIGSDTWVRVQGAWRLQEGLMISSREVLPSTDTETAHAVTAELLMQLHPLSTVEAGKPFDDLEALGAAIGEARFVSLGEATHGTREIFQMKHRLLEYLVKEKGFTVFAIEANWPESEFVDRYIKTGVGDPKDALAAMYFWIWQTHEVLTMIEWMRAFNQEPGKHPILSFTSFDMQTYDVARMRVLAYIKQYSPQDLATVEAAYSGLRTLNLRVRTDASFDEASKKADAIVTLLEARRTALIEASSKNSFRDALQTARIVAQATRMRTPGASLSYRDQMMASNVEWLASEAYPNQKIVLWAHNGHISKTKAPEFRPMGDWLRQSLGSQMYVLGFGINSGSVRAATREGGRSIGRAVSKIPLAEPGTGTAILSSTGKALYFLDLRNRTGVLGKWLAEPHLFRGCGAQWDRDAPDSFMRSEALSKSYDGLIYLENTQAAHGI